MGLVKKKHAADITEMTSAKAETISANTDATYEQLLADYRAGDAHGRREKARALRQFPEACDALLELLSAEDESVVRDALLNSLASMVTQQPEYLQASLERVIELLRQANASLRTQLVRFLAGFPDEMSELVPQLLADPNTNIRLYALDIVQSLRHPDVPQWLKQVIETEAEANVVISAIDRSVEAGCQEILDVLPGVVERFPDVEMLPFAVHMATERLEGAS